MRTIDRQTPKKRDLHLVLDNYATHKHSNVKTWLAKHPRFHLHFTPTSASWLNQVERFFGLTALRWESEYGKELMSGLWGGGSPDVGNWH